MTATATDEAMVGVGDVARMLHLSTDTVYALARSGEIPGRKFGNRWRFFPSAVREAVKPKPVDEWAMPPASRRARRAS